MSRFRGFLIERDFPKWKKKKKEKKEVKVIHNQAINIQQRWKTSAQTLLNLKVP